MAGSWRPALDPFNSNPMSPVIQKRTLAPASASNPTLAGSLKADGKAAGKRPAERPAGRHSDSDSEEAESEVGQCRLTPGLTPGQLRSASALETKM